MTTQEFEQHVQDHAVHDLNDAYCVVAINEEAGEIAGWYKKFVLRGNITGKHQESDLKGELGDVLYYLTRLASNHNWTLSEIMNYNKTKLDERVSKQMRQIV